jgi:hypothetical protein
MRSSFEIGFCKNSTVAGCNQVNVGVYASVLWGGTIHRGDLVRLEGQTSIV